MLRYSYGLLCLCSWKSMIFVFHKFLAISSIHGIFQGRILEWVAISFFRTSSWPRDWTRVSLIVGRRFTVWATREVKGSRLTHHGDESGDGITWQGFQSSPCKNDSTKNYKFSCNFWKIEKLSRETCFKRTKWKL